MKEIKFTQGGSKRIGYVKNCIICNKEYPVRKTHYHKAKFCSTICRHKGQIKKRKKLTCPICLKDFERKLSSLRAKNNIYFCSVDCKDKAARLDGIKEIWPYFYGTSGRSKSYRKIFCDEDLFCHRCGYQEFKECIDIHHIDGDRKNNSKNNLIPLCCACHRAWHMGLITDIDGRLPLGTEGAE